MAVQVVLVASARIECDLLPALIGTVTYVHRSSEVSSLSPNVCPHRGDG